MPCVGRWKYCTVLISCFLLLSLFAWADADDPPTRVGRMNFSEGQVSFQPGGEGDWVQAVPNRPLTAGDNLWSDRNSRAELHVGSTAIRIGSETSLTFLDLDDHTMQLRLAQGSVLLRVRHLDDDETMEIDTPNVAFDIQRNGEYRVDVNPDGQATVIDVFQGRGEAVGGGNNYTIVANQQATFTGDEQQLGYDISPLPRPDDLENWAFERDRREDRADSRNYVSQEMTGYEDLDEYGRWSYAANYGPVWVPASVPMGWAPYRYGHWVWIAPWGWTWVDDEPWGFAPFHYGRWCVINGGWAWVPGPVVTRPVYAPALVAFVGGGPGFHFSVSFGGGEGVAWFPLAPGEVYVPGYRVSRTYVNQVNVTNTVVNVTKVTNVYNNYTVNNNVTRITYVNQTAPNAVTAVSHDTFVNARPVARNVVRVPEREIAQAPVVRSVAIEPVRASAIGAGRPSVAPPRAVVTRQVVAIRAPSPPPTPLEKRTDPLVSRPGGAPRPGASSAIAKPEPGNVRGNQPAERPEASVPRPSGGNPSERPQPGNVRNQPAERPEATVPRPSAGNPPERPQPGNVRNQPPAERPEASVPRPSAGNPAERPDRGVPRPPADNTPERRAPEVSRPSAGGTSQPPEPARGGMWQTNRPRPEPPAQEQQQQGWSHPQVKPAPPVQPKSEREARDEEGKFQNWQRQQQAAPRQEQRAPAQRNEPPRNQKETPKQNEGSQRNEAPKHNEPPK
jgi:hypothetical protein